jgi:hypothetical protein
MSAMATLTVRRASAEDAQQRQVILTLDGEPFVTLLYNQFATREIAPGRHVLKANNTWNRDQWEFEAAEGEHLRAEVVNRVGRIGFLLVTFLGVGPMYVKIEPEISRSSR